MVLQRVAGLRMAPSLNGQSVVVENRAGAGGSLGAGQVASAAPDGYTLLVGSNGPLTVNPFVQAKLSYDPLKDFVAVGLANLAPHTLVLHESIPAKTVAELVDLSKKQPLTIATSGAGSAGHMHLSYDYTRELLPVCYLGRHGQILAAHKTLGVTSVKELVDYVKANPGLGLATSGVGSNQHVLCEWFKREADIKIDHVPYRGAGQAINDLIAAHAPRYESRCCRTRGPSRESGP